jgi:hypothetical protein
VGGTDFAALKFTNCMREHQKLVRGQGQH